MGLLLAATWAFYRQHPLQACLALFGIVLGVAAISAMDGVYFQASRAHSQALNSLYGPASHEITATDGGPLDEHWYVQLRRGWGDLHLAPIIKGPVRLGEQHLDLVGIDPFAASEIGQFSAFSQNRGGHEQQHEQARNGVDADTTSASTLIGTNPGVAPGAVALAADSATRFNLSPGDTFSANIGGRTERLQLAQTWPSAGWAENWLLTDLAQAQHWLKRPGQLDRILVAPRNQAELDWIAQQLPAHLRLALVDERRGVARMSQAFYTNLRAMGLLAWLLGLFLAYNAYALLNRQRWHEFAHWRTLGLTRRELVSSQLFEALLLGTLGGVLGLLVGRYLAALILPLVTSVGASFYGGAIATNLRLGWDWRQAALGPLAAIAAVLPLVWRTQRMRPAQLGRASTSVDKATIHWWAGALGILALSAANGLRQSKQNSWLDLSSLGLNIFDLGALGNSAVNRGFAVLFLLMVGYALLIPLLLRFLLALIPGHERLAAALLRQQIQRQGVAQAAFVLALAAGLGIGIMIQSFRDSVADWLEQVLWADLYLSVPNGAHNSPLDANLLAQLQDLPGVEYSGAVRSSRWPDSHGEWYNLNAYALADEALQRFPLFAGAHEHAYTLWQQGAGWFVNESLAQLRGIKVGQVISLLGPDGPVSLPVLAINADYSADEGALVLAWSSYLKHFKDPALDAVGMRFYQHEEAPKLRAELQQRLPIDAAPRWISQHGIQQRSLEVFDQTFSVTQAGRSLILLIALVALTGAMTAMVVAQRPWLGTLRALGATPRELFALILEQGLWLGFAAAILALPLGIAVSWVLAQDIMRASFGWLLPLHWEWREALRVLLQALTVAVLASLYPAWRWRHENLRHTEAE